MVGPGILTETLKTGHGNGLDVILAGVKRKQNYSNKVPVCCEVGRVPLSERVRLSLRTPISDVFADRDSWRFLPAGPSEWYAPGAFILL